jgi:uncharacterized protein (TIGR03000 family)
MYSVVLLMAMTGTPDTAAFGHRHGCDGGCQGCQGYSGCSGYNAGCCGCQGERHHKKQRGHSCGGCHGCQGCYGGGCSGMQAGCGCCGTPVYQGGCYGAPMMTTPPAGTPPVKGAMYAAPATVVVSLPADATLTVDGVATQSTTELRTFATPVLPVGQAYHYTLTAAVVRDGQTLTATQQVTVQAGVTSRVELPATAFGTAVAAN